MPTVRELHEVIDSLPDWEETDEYDIVVSLSAPEAFGTADDETAKYIEGLEFAHVRGVFLDGKNKVLRLIIV